MAKKKTTPPLSLEPSEKKADKTKLIEAAMIAGTFVAIALLSVVTEGPGDTWPDWRIILTRIALLSVTSAIYFYMLLSTRTNPKGDAQETSKKK